MDAVLVDSKFVKRKTTDSTSGAGYQVWDYMVELTGIDGQPTRLVIRQDASRVVMPDKGELVPVLVNKKRTKAALDKKDPRIDLHTRQKVREAARKSADEARFAEQLANPGSRIRQDDD